VLNDLFDIYKDHHNGVQTLVTNTADIPFIAKELKALESTFMAQYQALDYPATAKQKSLTAIMAIVTRGHVALVQYLKAARHNQKLDVAL
jgi:hypothetical protein